MSGRDPRPSIDRTDSDTGVEVRKLLGEWDRSQPLDVRHRVSEQLRAGSAKQLVIDLSDISFIDSWGEDLVCDALQRAVDDHMTSAWVADPSRTGDYEGIRRALARRQLLVDEFGSVPQAKVFLAP